MSEAADLTLYLMDKLNGSDISPDILLSPPDAETEFAYLEIETQKVFLISVSEAKFVPAS